MNAGRTVDSGSHDSLGTRVGKVLRNNRWLILGGLTALTLVLGYVGFDGHFDATGEPRSFFDKLYLDVQLFILESGSIVPPIPWPLQVARFAAPAIAALAALAALAAVFRGEFARLRARWYARKHVVICGLGACGERLAEAFAKGRDRVVVIERAEANPAIEECRRRGSLVLIGDASDSDLLGRARVGRARYLVAVCGDDGLNAEVAAQARRCLDKQRVSRRRSRTRDALRCFVHIDDPELSDLLKQSALSGAGQGHMRLEFFNSADGGPAALLAAHSPFGPPGAVDTITPHALVVGCGALGSRLVVQLARRWRRLRPSAGDRMRVTVVDRDAVHHVAALRSRYRGFDTLCDLVAHPLEVSSPEFHGGEFLDNPPVTGAYVGLSDDARGLEAALVLSRLLSDRGLPVVVRTAGRVSLAALLQRPADDAAKVCAVDVMSSTCTPKVILNGLNELLARAIHDDYARQQAADGETPATNPSMVPWEELPEGLRESNRAQAADISVKLDAVRCRMEPLTDLAAEPLKFSDDEVEQLAILEHDRWWKEREEAGWVPGSKIPDRKQSPYLVPWEEVPENVKEFDRRTVRQLPVFLAAAGFAVVRLPPAQRSG